MRYQVIQSDGVVVESHSSLHAAQWAANVLTEHENRCAEDRARGLPEALKADRPGRPFTYTVREVSR